MGLVLEPSHSTLADEMLARKLYSASSRVIPHLQMVKPLSCKYDSFTFPFTPSRIFACFLYAGLWR